MSKTKDNDCLVLPNAIIPVANISHILKPDDAIHIWLKNGVDLRFKDLDWDSLAKAMKGSA